MGVLKIVENHFEIDGKPLQIISGAIHYFRVVPEYWRDRLLKLKACGFNTVETYVPWNLHEPKPGVFNFEGMADIEQFVQVAGELGLNVIVRPGPYICSEWEFGGLPAWLLADPDVRLRCFNKAYLNYVDRFFDELLSRMVPLLSTNGGPIVAMQVENEYGSYGNDKDYLQYLKDGMIRRGIDVLLFTSDGPTDGMMQGGTLPDVYKTANFGSDPQGGFAKLKEYQTDKPLMCMEYWNGWFDHWGGPHHTRDGEDVADVFDRMLKMGASVNFYMFHGGTNFGFMNGANYDQKYTPTISSYDYDSPLSESGDPTDKFYAVQRVISKYATVEKELMPEPAVKKAYGKVTLNEHAELFKSLEAISKPVYKETPEPMENLGQNYGYILYRTRIAGPRNDETLYLQDVHDRALVFLDGALLGIIDRNSPNPLNMNIPKEGAQLDILVENLGRVNYGPHLRDHKGITEGVRLWNQFLYGWTMFPLPMEDLSGLNFSKEGSLNAPGFFKGTLSVDQPADTFLLTKGWKKGIAFINGFNLGRYWEIGPTRTLYIPAPLLKKGDNEVLIFELEGCDEPVVEFVDTPDLG